MKKIMFIFFLIFLLPAIGETEALYVSGVMEVTLRTGPGTDHRVLSMVKTGQAVEVLMTGDDWTQVQLPNGKEGWILSRFLTDKEPFSVVFDQTKKKNEQLVLQLKALSEENEKLKKTNGRLESELTENKKNLNELKKSYKTLKNESSEYLKLKAEYKKSAAELATHREKTRKIEAELGRLRLRTRIWWFLSGAGVLFFGFLMGLGARRQRRRSSLL